MLTSSYHGPVLRHFSTSHKHTLEDTVGSRVDHLHLDAIDELVEPERLGPAAEALLERNDLEEKRRLALSEFLKAVAKNAESGAEPAN